MAKKHGLDLSTCAQCGISLPQGAIGVSTDLIRNFCSDRCRQVHASRDMVNHPPHYTVSGIEPIDVIEAWKFGFCLGNAVKYIARAEHKGTSLQDLEKARWYLDREIERRKKEQQKSTASH